MTKLATLFLVAMLSVTAADAEIVTGDIVDAFHAALAKGDGDAALSYLDEKIQIYEQGWVERSKAEYAASHLASDMKFSAATTSTQTSRAYETVGNLAYVTTEGRTTGTFEGKPVDSITLETMVLRRAAGGWRIVHIHWSSRKAP